MEKEKKQNWAHSVVDDVISKCKSRADTAFIAALKRADNPDTEYQAWEYLARYNVDIEKDYKRLPYVTVFSAIARANPGSDGFLQLGAAIAKCYEDGNKSDQARSKLRRVLACNSLNELCRVLRSLLRLIESKQVKVSYGSLLDDLCYFNEFHSDKIKARWAQSFFYKFDKEEEIL